MINSFKSKKKKENNHNLRHYYDKTQKLWSIYISFFFFLRVVHLY